MVDGVDMVDGVNTRVSGWKRARHTHTHTAYTHTDYGVYASEEQSLRYAESLHGESIKPHTYAMTCCGVLVCVCVCGVCVLAVSASC